jgi:Flp pilus assembly CpaE family ATPase
MNVDGIYTRYADNLFFSVKTEEFPRSVRQTIIKLVEGRKMKHGRKRGRRRFGSEFQWHKLKVGPVDGRMLGLNICDAKLYNTRDFKRKLRKVIHHMKWVLTNTTDEKAVKKATHKFSGLMSHVQQITLPKKIKKDIKEVKKVL